MHCCSLAAFSAAATRWSTELTCNNVVGMLLQSDLGVFCRTCELVFVVAFC